MTACNTAYPEQSTVKFENIASITIDSGIVIIHEKKREW